MAAEVGFVEFMGFARERLPGWCTCLGPGQQQLLTGVAKSHVADVGVRETTTAHESIAWHSRPTGFDVERPNTVAEREEMANHRRRSDRKPVTVFRRDLNTGAGAVRVTCKRCKSTDQPIDSRFAQKIVGISQREILRHIPAACETRSLFRFR